MIESRNYKTKDEIISYICKCEYEYFFKKPYVVGIARGYKIKNGFITNKKCIKVFVSKKVPLSNLYEYQVIPKFFKCIETDVVESGEFNATEFTGKVRPVIGGYSIGVSNIRGVGSVGCLVTDGRYKYILSNNHILANINTVPIGTPIIQPGLDDGGKSSTDIVALLSKYIPLKTEGLITTPTNYTDCAIAKLINESIASPKIAIVGAPEVPMIPIINKEVKKVGRSTEMTTGRITDIDGTFHIRFDSKKAFFEEQIVTTHMSEEGDSGSILLYENNYVVGLSMANGKSHSIFNDIGKVLKALKVKIVSE
ncbi:hypothetical protein IRP63_15840 (plasmid) [Clostridium botulinum]|uniref:Nal1 N-terminal domain-containing protein n=1 Tax=Clostridium botulinum C/D str. DC5 TaxID=1443128 RepID=A0A0A0HUY1_CLOBO|nr:hypothetical protein [Clostridium botulinum]KEH99928.1 hypothetical protein Z952_14805 [Clostridium botulinum C/D str. BKT75002]KEI05562.1 hypothetical protein Z954_15015 [Clostridium botulinum C/D str. BKT2873]KGM93004.1 hypothetical protein Z955_16230 [Clostridium botulinum C/D str. DC5]KOC46644.1 hypothetical protein ADU88_11790 [Clostridium botulinum]KOC51398.1 hypothetical protein ADU89_13620 [Clostridium botulinum]